MTKLPIASQPVLGGTSRARVLSKKSLRQKLMFAASASMMTLAAPLSGLYGTRASAQGLTVECDDVNVDDPSLVTSGNGFAEDGETITCVAPGPLAFNVDDLSVNVTGITKQVEMYGAGAQTIVIEDNASGISSNRFVDVTVTGDSTTPVNDLTIRSDSKLEGTLNNSDPTVGAINATNLGSGKTYIETHEVKFGKGRGINVYSGAQSTGIVVKNTGYVSSEFDVIYVDHRGSGQVNIYANNVSAFDKVGDAVAVKTGTNSTGININGVAPEDDIGGSSFVGRNGVLAEHGGTGSLNINVENAQGLSNAIEAKTATISDQLNISGSGRLYALGTVIEARHYGAGNASITANEVVSQNVHGIDVRTGALTQDLTINTRKIENGQTIGSVISKQNGIYVIHKGTGDLRINAHDVRSNDGRAIGAFAYYGANVYIDASGKISAGGISGNGIRAIMGTMLPDNDSSGNIYISANDVAAYDDSAIWGRFYDGSNGNMNIHSVGHIDGDDGGVIAFHQGDGHIDIELNTVTGSTNQGVKVDTRYGDGTVQPVYGTGDINVTINGYAKGSSEGIYIDNARDGDVYINANRVEGGTYGIKVNAEVDTKDVKIVGRKNVNGAYRGLIESKSKKGIYVKQYGEGSVDLTVHDVAGRTYGIDIETGSTSGEITLRASGQIRGKLRDALVADHGGDGDIRLYVHDVFSEQRDAVDLNATSDSSANIYLTATGDIFADDIGIDVSQNGDGIVSLNVGNVYGNFDDAIEIYADEDASDILITATGRLQGDEFGIYIENDGVGKIVINAPYTEGVEDDGIFIETEDLAAGITINARKAQGGSFVGLARGYENGISVENDGIGEVSITAHDVTATKGVGINVEADDSTAGVSVVSSGFVSAYDHGVYINHDGEGDVYLSVNDVTSRDQNGINVENTIDNTNVTVISKGLVFGHEYGIYILHEGEGNVSLRAHNVRSQEDDGIYVDFDSTGARLSVITTGYVVGDENGIELEMEGSGPSYIKVHDVRGHQDDGFYIDTGTASAGIRFEATGLVRGLENGIYIDHDGTGDTLIYANHVKADEDIGIDVSVDDLASATTLVVTGDVEAFDDAIEVAHDGDGLLSISAANLLSRDDRGLDVYTESSDSTGIDIDVSGQIQSKSLGADIKHDGTGDVSLNVNNVWSRDDNAIQIENETVSNAIEVKSVGLVQGNGYGLRIYQNGQGITDITVNDVIAETENGIYIESVSTAQSVYVQANGTVTSERVGISIDHMGNGTVEVTLGADGAIISEEAIGVRVRNDRNGVSALVQGSSGVIDGGVDLLTRNGDITVQNLTSVAGTNWYGILARSGGGAITIQNIGSVTGAGFNVEAIHANSFWTRELGGNISIQNVAIPTFDHDDNPDTANVRSPDGIRALSSTGNINIGFGDLDDKDDDAVSAIGDIYVYGRAIDANSVSGAIDINIAGQVDAGADAIVAVTSAQTTITIAETSSVSAGGEAIQFNLDSNASADDTLSLYGSILSGDVLMNTGNDTFNYGGTLADGVTVYGGDGVDTLNFASTTEKTFTDTVDPDGKIQEFEILGFSGDNITLAGRHSGWDAVNFNRGTTTLDGTLDVPVAFIASGATLNAKDNAVFIGDLTNSGTINIGSSPGRFTVFGDFEQTDSGVLPIEIFRTGLDQLRVRGTATLDGTLSIVTNLSNLPEDMQSFEILTADLPIVGAFSEITDDLPDLDFGYIETAADPTTITVTYTAPIVEDPTDPTPDPDPDPTPTPDPDPSPAPTPDPGPPVQNPDPTPEPEPDPEPLLSAKEIVPSGLSAAMRVNDMFVENLIQRRAVQITPDQWNFWTNGFGGQHDVGMTGGTPGWDGDTGGLALGVERLISLGGNPVLFGAAGGYTEASITSDASHGDIEGYHLGAFANADMGPLFVAGSLAYAWQDYGFERAIIGPSSATLAYGETEGTGWALKSEAFYDLLGDAETGTSFGPVATFGSTIAEYDGFKETGASILNLNWSDESAYQTVLGLGGEGGFEADLNGLTFDTGLRVLWESVGGDRALQTRAFLDVPGAQFKPRAATLDANRVAVSFDTKLYLTEGLFAHIRYDTTRGENLIDHEGWAGITLRF